jgi:hypothetical protein
MPTHAKNRKAARAKQKAAAEAKVLAAAKIEANKPRVGYSTRDQLAGNMNVRDADYIPFNQFMQMKRMAERYPDNSAYPGIIANMEKSGKVEFDANSADDNRAITDTVNRLFPERQYGLNYAQGKYIADGNIKGNEKIKLNEPTAYDNIGGNVRIDDGKGGAELWQNDGPRLKFTGIDGTEKEISDAEIRRNTQVVQKPVFSGGQGTIVENRQYVPKDDPFIGKYDNSYWDDMEEATPNWGENPGFRWKVGGNRIEGDGLTRLPGAGFWAADTDSDFWKTDAGAAKAVTSWPSEDGSLPSFVKQPKQQEVDIQGIKNWFRENWGK